MKNRISVLICSIFLSLTITGCYEKKVQEAVSQLKIGMTRTEVNDICKELIFLKEQKLLPLGNIPANKMQGHVGPDHDEVWYPDNLVENLTFEDDMVLVSYLIKREKSITSPVFIEYLGIFIDHKQDRAIGWAKMYTSGDIDTWDEKYP